MEFKNLNRAFGIASFVLALVVYMLTVQTSVPFWDCSEFANGAVWQQVPHPPGAPLFLMVGKVFDVLIPFGDPGWKMNLVSVFASAFCVWLLYHIIVMLIRNFKRDAFNELGSSLAVYGAAFVGATAYIFTDTFWFNAVESEVYAIAQLFTNIVVFLMMKWNEKADEQGHEKYLLLLAYIIGLSTGVHLLAVLCIFSVIFMVYFRKYPFSIMGFVKTSIFALIVFACVYPGIVKWVPALLAGHTPGRNEVGEFAIEDSTFLTILMIGIIIFAIWAAWNGIKNKKQVQALFASGFLFILMGYTTYTHILIRSNANPPMNENEPKDFADLAYYLGREQYGNEGSWPRRVKADDQMFINNYVAKDENGEFIYGEWNPPSRVPMSTKDGRVFNVVKWDNVNVAGELAYMWKWQMKHMYWRYFGWNFIGRTSDEQDAGVAVFDKNDQAQLNYKSPYADKFPVRFFALPLIFGLIGLFYHYKRDPKMAFNYTIMFLLMGVLMAIAQNQQDPQPRERDYFYTGSFMIWCAWIGLGVYYLIESLSKEKTKTAVAGAVTAASFVLVPINMAANGWAIHDRTGNTIPFDYSYNILQSVDKDAILFTNGDNDTFPVWYTQDVMGVRRDVRIVNLSLGNTLWYIKQLKDREPWGAKRIPLSFSDRSLNAESETDEEALTYDFGPAKPLSIPVRREIMEKYTTDSLLLARGTFDVSLTGMERGGTPEQREYVFRLQDKLVEDILKQIRFERPVYYSNTVGPDAFCGLESYFRFEGMAMRICPVPQNDAFGDNMDLDVTEKCLMNIDETDNYSKTPKYGFKIRGFKNAGLYLDPSHRKISNTYRQLYISLAESILRKKKDEKRALAAIDKMNELISPEAFPMDFDFEARIAKLYSDLGQKEKALRFADMSIKSGLYLVNHPTMKPDMMDAEMIGRYKGPYTVTADMYVIREDYKAAIDLLKKLLVKSEGVMKEIAAVQGYENEKRQVTSLIYTRKRDIFTYEVREAEKKGGKQAAIDKTKEIIDRLAASQNEIERALLFEMNKSLRQLNGEPDTAAQYSISGQSLR